MAVSPADASCAHARRMLAAGKSSLISAMKRLGGTGGRGEPTIAPVPGTTLGLLRVPGLPLGPKHRTFDTPGAHPGEGSSPWLR